MKRPIALYFVASWCFFALTIQANNLTQVLASGFSAGQESEDLQRTLFTVTFVLVVWHTIRLVRLKSFNRWFSIVTLGWWTVMLTWNIFIVIERLERPFRAVMFSFIFGMLNIACAWYLARRSFRSFAVEFVTEREREKRSRMLEKASQEALAKEIKSHK